MTAARGPRRAENEAHATSLAREEHRSLAVRRERLGLANALVDKVPVVVGSELELVDEVGEE